MVKDALDAAALHLGFHIGWGISLSLRCIVGSNPAFVSNLLYISNQSLINTSLMDHYDEDANINLIFLFYKQIIFI